MKTRRRNVVQSPRKINTKPSGARLEGIFISWQQKVEKQNVVPFPIVIQVISFRCMLNQASFNFKFY